MKRLTKMIMRAFISAPSRVGLLALATAFGLAGAARAESDGQVCGPQTLSGSYVFTAQGFNIVSGAAQPKAIIEGIDFHGDGTLSVPFATVSINGIIIHAPPGGTGTYTLDESCEGTLTFTSGPVNYDISVRRNGRELQMIQTDANTVFQGTVLRVSR